MRTLPFPSIVLLSLILFATPAFAAQVGAVSDAACARMQTHGVRKADSPVPCSRLRIVYFSYLGFDGKTHHDGEIMVLDAVADSVRGIFEELLQRRFPLARARLMHHYHGDDAASMRDNNSSSFNHRSLTGGGPLSLHAYGLAIDINPVQNPYIALNENGHASVAPESGVRYLNRTAQRPGKAARHGLAEEAVQVFARHGFPVWGGDWDNPIDYQHFQVSRRLAERLLDLPPDQAQKLFQLRASRYQDCMKAARGTDAVCRQGD